MSIYNDPVRHTGDDPVFDDSEVIRPLTFPSQLPPEPIGEGTLAQDTFGAKTTAGYQQMTQVTYCRSGVITGYSYGVPAIA